MASKWISTSGYWDVSTDWAPTGAPTSGDVVLDTTSGFGAYSVTIRSPGTYALNNLTVTGTASSLVTLLDTGSLSFSGQLAMTYAVVTLSTVVNSAGGLSLNGNATLNLNSDISIGGQATSGGFANTVNEHGASFRGTGGNFSPMQWNLAAKSKAVFSAQVSGAVNFSFSDATVDVLSFGAQGTQFSTGSIKGFQALNVMDLTTIAFGSGGFTAKTVGTGLEIDQGGLAKFSIANFAFASGTSWKPTDLVFAKDAVGGTQVTVCFAEGSRIATPDGEAAIETLRPGDLVTVMEAEGPESRPIRFVGHRFIKLSAHPEPGMVAPIRILAGAIADRLPCRDLVVSPDHSILFGDVLIPARLLINHRTVVQELARASVRYFHLELDRHAIILAEGVACESYLDQGNRGFFDNSGEPVVLHPDLTTVQTGETCVPVVAEGPAVLDAWTRIAERGRALPGIQPTTPEADLRLFADGRELRPIRAGRFLQFVLPAGIGEIRLMSRSARPASIQPWLNDRRRLGVCLRRIAVRQANEVRIVPLDHPSLSQGWWAVDAGGGRWTDGDARLSLPAMGAAILELEVAAQGAYLAAAA